MKRIFTAFFLSMILFACGPGEDAVRLKNKGTYAGEFSLNTCQGNQLAVRLEALPGLDFRQSVGGLVSATMDPGQLGYVSGEPSASTGVEVRLGLVFDQNKQLISGESQFRLIVRDSLVGTTGTDGKLIEAIEILHNGSSQLRGSWDSSSKILNVSYSDEFGWIQINGLLESQGLVGKITFSNSLAWDSSSPRSGTLGAFKAQSCSF